MQVDEIVLQSLAEGSSLAKHQLTKIQTEASSLEHDSLAYLTFYFYMTERLRLGCNSLEETYADEKATELRTFVEKRAKRDHEEAPNNI